MANAIAQNDGPREQKLTLLPQLGLALLDGAQSHVTDGSSGNLVQASSTAKNGDDVQVLGAGVVGAVHHGAHGKCERSAELGAGGDTTALLLLAGCCRGHLGEDAETCCNTPTIFSKTGHAPNSIADSTPSPPRAAAAAAAAAPPPPPIISVACDAEGTIEDGQTDEQFETVQLLIRGPELGGGCGEREAVTLRG